MKTLKIFLALLIIFSSANIWSKQKNTLPKSEPSALNSHIPVAVDTPFSPIPFKASDDKTYLVYEVYFSYLPPITPEKLILKRFDVLDKNTQKVYASYQGKALNEIIRQTAAPKKGSIEANTTTLTPGTIAILYPMISIAKDQPIPNKLIHRFTFTSASTNNNHKSSSKEETLEANEVRVNKTAKVASLSSPLVGGGWVSLEGLIGDSHHLRDIITIGGGIRVPQRFAVDWMQVDATGMPYNTAKDPKKNESYYCYGAPLLAAADGIVVSAVDEFPDNNPVGHIIPAVQNTKNAAGNYISLSIGDGQYLFYAHVKPGSMKVKVGDKVKRGQVIGQLGNSGSSTAPHLHIELANANSILGAEGIPYTFDQFGLQMTPEAVKEIQKDNNNQKVLFDPNKPGIIRYNEMPLGNSVIYFFKPDSTKLQNLKQ